MEGLIINENQDFYGDDKINLYKNIFGEAPWNEGFICKNCNKIFNMNFSGDCDCSDSLLEEFYKPEELKEEFKILSLKNGYKELIASIIDENIGFIWGWNSSLNGLNKDKLNLGSKQVELLKSNVLKLYPDFNFENFYYFAEIGVKNNYRGKDIAGMLYRKNLDELKSRGEKYILVRTTRKTDVPYKWFIKNGYKDVFLYEDEQDRVILVYKI